VEAKDLLKSEQRAPRRPAPPSSCNCLQPPWRLAEREHGQLQDEVARLEHDEGETVPTSAPATAPRHTAGLNGQPKFTVSDVYEGAER
jgi:hypothetical protein